MGDGQYFMRVRGRVMGPFDQEKLQGLSRRGQLSRMHEVSTDGVTWVQASKFPELFVVAPTESAADPSAAHGVETESGDQRSFQNPTRSAASAQHDWFYMSFGQQCGPVEFSKMQLLAATGQLGAQDMVWTNGMAEWLPAGQVPGVMQAPAHAEADHHATGVQRAASEETLPAGLCTAATTSRSWVLFIAITGYILGAFFLVGGLLLVIVGAKKGTEGATGIFSGLTDLILCAIVVAGSLMLSSYASRVGALSHSQNPIVLEKALVTLRQFWIFVSINLIVWLAFVVAFFILLFSSVIALPTF